MKELDDLLKAIERMKSLLETIKFMRLLGLNQLTLRSSFTEADIELLKVLRKQLSATADEQAAPSPLAQHLSKLDGILAELVELRRQASITDAELERVKALRRELGASDGKQ